MIFKYVFIRIYLRLSFVVLSKAMRLHSSLSRERTRLPYCFSISLADRFVVMWVFSFFEMNRSYLLNMISAMTLHSFPKYFRLFSVPKSSKQ